MFQPTNFTRFVSFIVCSQFFAASAQEWPRHRGLNGAGIGEADLPAEISAETVRWKTELPGQGHSAPVLWGEQLYLTSAEPVEQGDSGTLVLHGIDATTGESLWTVDLPFAAWKVNRKFNTPASSSVATDATHVYLSRADGESILVHAFTHKGEPVWKKSFPGFDDTDHGMIPSPSVVGDVLVVPAEHIGSGSFLAALDCKTGETLWSISRSQAKDSYSTPVVHEQEDGTQQLITVTTDGGFTALNLEDGSLIWEYNPGYGQRSVGSPVIANGILFGALGAGGGAKESAAIIPGTLDREPEVLYEINKALPYVPSALVVGEEMYFLNDAGMLSCLDQKSGELHYDRERLSEAPSVKWFSSPVSDGKKIFLCSQGGEVVCVNAGTAFEVLARSQLDGAINAAPAIAGGRLFLRTAETLYCVGSE